MTKKAWMCEGIKPTDKLVLLALADRANGKTGLCYPSITTLATMTGLCRRSVMRSVQALEDAGVIRRDKGRGVSTHYELLVTESHQCQRVTSDRESPTSDRESPALVTESHPNLEDNLEVTKNIVDKPKRQKKPDIWKQFFAAYPSHRKGGKDESAWKKAKSMRLTEEDFEKMVFDVSNRYRDTSSQYIPGICKYLSEHIWLTEIPPEENNGNRQGQNSSKHQSRIGAILAADF